MLDAMTPGEFRERQIADLLDPIDDSWLQTGTICAAIHNAVMLALSAFAGDESEPPKLAKPGDYIPKVSVKKAHLKSKAGAESTLPRRRLSARESEAVLRARFGNK